MLVRNRKSKAECPAVPPHYEDERCDCRERADCSEAGQPNHLHCGVCGVCGFLSFQGHAGGCSTWQAREKKLQDEANERGSAETM